MPRGGGQREPGPPRDPEHKPKPSRTEEEKAAGAGCWPDPRTPGQRCPAPRSGQPPPSCPTAASPQQPRAGMSPGASPVPTSSTGPPSPPGAQGLVLPQWSPPTARGCPFGSWPGGTLPVPTQRWEPDAALGAVRLLGTTLPATASTCTSRKINCRETKGAKRGAKRGACRCGERHETIPHDG